MAFHSWEEFRKWERQEELARELSANAYQAQTRRRRVAVPRVSPWAVFWMLVLTGLVGLLLLQNLGVI